MTTLTLTINATNFLPQYKTGSAKISELLLNQGNTMEMEIVQKTGQSAPAVGKEIIFKDGSRYLFAGFITKCTPTEYGVGQAVIWKIECTDYTYILINKSVQGAYENKTLAYIVDDILDMSVDASYGITDTNVATGPTIETINFNHISVRQALENLAKVTGYVWWVDYTKDIHFVAQNTGATAPESFKDSVPTNHESLMITYDLAQVRNDITVIGGVQESSSYSQVFLGDTFAREWVLLEKVFTMTSIELDTGAGYVTKNVGVDPKDDELGNDFMYNPERGAIRCTATTTTPNATSKVKVTYTYPLNVLTEVKSAPSITLMQGLEGGDGIHAHTINDSTIVSNGQAQQRALKELDDFQFPTVVGKVITRTGLLTAGSYFHPGQIVTINSSTYGIASDTPYMIQKVVTTLVESGSAIEYFYDISFGGRNIGVVDFLQALASPESPLDTSGQITKIQALADILTISEVITRNSGLHSNSDTITVAESISKANVTPPFKWGVNATANKGIFGKSEWG